MTTESLKGKMVIFPHIESIPVEAVEYFKTGKGTQRTKERMMDWLKIFELGEIDPDNEGQFRDTQPYIDGLSCDCIRCEVKLRQ